MNVEGLAMLAWQARSLLGSLLLTAVCCAPAARAQAGGQADGDADDPEARREAVIKQTRSEIERSIAVWVFGRPRLPLYHGENEATYVIKARLEVEIDDLERSCGISSAQKKKLEAAGRGDIKRFFDRYEKIKKECLARVDGTRPNELAMAFQNIQPLRATFQAGILGNGSIYRKVLESTLGPEQVARHAKAERERTLYEYESSLAMTLEMLNELVGFTREQAEQLLELMRKETLPPRELGKQKYYAVLNVMSTIPEAKLKTIFDEFQFRCLKQSLDQARGLGPWLKSMGFVPAEAASAGPPVDSERREDLEPENARGKEIKVLNRRDHEERAPR